MEAQQTQTRKLVTLRQILALDPIPEADKIEVATVDGWKVIVQKGLYKVGDWGFYHEIDSLLPEKPAYEFMRKYRFRVKTIKLKGQLSQGLLIPYAELCDEAGCIDLPSSYVHWDFSEVLGVIKWEPTLPASLAGHARGNFPSYIPKTDQERVQNLRKELEDINPLATFEVTEKLDGSSMTVYLNMDGEFGVCSRNLDLKETEGNTQWRVAREMKLEEKMRHAGLPLALQGELVGPGIQKNRYGFKTHRFMVYDVYHIKDGRYCRPAERKLALSLMGLTLDDHVPILEKWYKPQEWSMDALIKYADGYSVFNGSPREGLVFKENSDTRFSFKAISNDFLLQED